MHFRASGSPGSHPLQISSDPLLPQSLWWSRIPPKSVPGAWESSWMSGKGYSILHVSGESYLVHTPVGISWWKECMSSLVPPLLFWDENHSVQQDLISTWQTLSSPVLFTAGVVNSCCSWPSRKSVWTQGPWVGQIAKQSVSVCACECVSGGAAPLPCCCCAGRWAESCCHVFCLFTRS